MSIYIPDPPQCGNKWCQSGRGSFPASGELRVDSECAQYNNLIKQQLTTGGITGRGVTPCPFGYIETVPLRAPPGVREIFSWFNKDYDQIAAQATVLNPLQPTYLPPQGGMRPLTRVGNEWKN